MPPFVVLLNVKTSPIHPHYQAYGHAAASHSPDEQTIAPRSMTAPPWQPCGTKRFAIDPDSIAADRPKRRRGERDCIVRANRRIEGKAPVPENVRPWENARGHHIH